MNFTTNLMGGYLSLGFDYLFPRPNTNIKEIESFLTEEDFEHCIDFEDQPEDTVLYNQYGDLGVIFPYSPRIVSPAIATISGVHALSTKDFGEEMDPTPLTIQFTAPQSKVGAYVGIDEDTSGVKVYATMSAYDENHDLVTEYGPVSLTTGPRPINRLMYVTSETANIWWIEIQFDNARPEFIDNLLFSAVGPAPPLDTQPPYIHILSPENNGVYDSFEGENCFTLDGTIEENDKLKEVRMTVYWEDQSVVHNVSFSGSALLFYFGHNTLKCLLNEGDNYITIQAADYRGLMDSKSVKVTYVPLRQESELLIVTPWELRPALLSLSDHKNNTGIPTSIISVEAIADDPRFFHGDDLPGMIKLAISYAYKNYNCRYVMLVGDSDKFPVRYCRLPDPNSNSSFAPSDLYYADLYRGDGSFDNWDSNGNGYYGEINMVWGSSSTYSSIFIDQVNMRPDIAVGRLPASSYSEVATYCDKVIAYESDNYKYWFDEILLLTGDPGYNSDEATNDWIAANCLNGFIKIEYYYPRMQEPEMTEQLRSTIISTRVWVLSAFSDTGRLMDIAGFMIVLPICSV